MVTGETRIVVCYGLLAIPGTSLIILFSITYIVSLISGTLTKPMLRMNVKVFSPVSFTSASVTVHFDSNPDIWDLHPRAASPRRILG